MSRHKALQGTDLAPQTDLVDLWDERVDYFAFEGTENDGLVLDREYYIASAGLNETGADRVDGSYCDNKSVSEERRAIFKIWIIIFRLIYEQYFPEQVPSTSLSSFCLTVSSKFGPKYLGWSRMSCWSEILLRKSEWCLIT